MALGPPRPHDARGADPRDGVHAGLRRGQVRHDRQALGTASGHHGRRDSGGTAAAAVVVDDRVPVGGAWPDLRVAVARHSPPEDHAAVALRSALPDDDDLAGPRGALPRERHARVSTRASTPRTFDDQPPASMPNTRGGRSTARVELLDGPGRSYRGLRRLCHLRACARGQGVRRFGVAAKRYPNRRGVPAAQQHSGDCTHDEDEYGEHEHPPPAAPRRWGRGFDRDRLRLRRRDRRRFDDDCGGRGGAAGLGRSTTSGSSLRACSASTGSTSTSSGLIGPRCPEPRPGSASTRTVLQAHRRDGERASKPKESLFASNLAPKAHVGRGASRPML